MNEYESENENSDSEYTCSLCKAIIQNDDKTKLRHDRICSKLSFNEESSLSNTQSILVTVRDNNTKSSIFKALTLEELNLKDNNELLYIEEIDISNKDLIYIINKKNIDFTDMISLISLNISCNNLINISFLIYISSIKILDISNNNIDDISPIENLTKLENFNGSNNKIATISSLIKLGNIREVLLNMNNLQYSTSTFRVLKQIKSLRVLSIGDNPFLDEVPLYKHIFINKIKNIEVLDGVRITDIETDIAKEYVRNIGKEHNNILLSSIKNENEEEEEEDVSTCEKNFHKETIKFKGNVITKIEKEDKTSKKDSLNKPVDSNTKLVKSNVKNFNCTANISNTLNKQVLLNKISKEVMKKEKERLNVKVNNKISDRNEESSKDLKISSLEIQIENLMNLTKQLENENENLKNENENLKISNKSVISNMKDKQLKLEK